MALLEPVAYDADGDLLAPSARAISQTSTQLAGRPSLDAGFYHRHSFRAYTAADRDAQMKRFFGFMASVRGFSSVIIKTYEYPFAGVNIYGAHVVYAVEEASRQVILARS